MVSASSSISSICAREYSEKVASSDPANSTYADIARTVLFSKSRKIAQNIISSELQKASLQPADVILKTNGATLKTHRLVLEFFDSCISKAEPLHTGNLQIELGLTVNEAKLFLDILHQKDEFSAPLSATSLIHVLKEFKFYGIKRPAIQCQIVLQALFFQDSKTFPEALIACSKLSSKLEGTAEIKEWALDLFIVLEENYTLPQSDQERLFSFFSKREDYFSYFVIAECHFRGWGTKKSLNKALDLYRSASKPLETPLKNPLEKERFHLIRGRALTMYSLYLRDKNMDLTDSAKLAVDETAFRCAKEAAELGHPLGITKLGICYLEGYGVEKDKKKAIVYLQQAAEMQSPFAMQTLAEHYIYSENKAQKGIAYLEKAAEMGFAESINELGDCYESGIGVEKDLKKAFQHFEKAAFLGDKNAMPSLGLCYLEGKGIEKNISKWLEIFRTYATGGNQDPNDFLKLISESKEEKSD